MDIDKAILRAEQLRKELEYHNRLYYVEATQEIGDAEYDSLMDELRKIEEIHPHLCHHDSPTQRVGGTPLEEFQQINHPVRMLSIEDIHELKKDEMHKSGANEDSKLVEWYQKLIRSLPDNDVSFTVEPKIDGVAVSLMYIDGTLEYAATRGDGNTGDDITQNIRTIHSVPLKLIQKSPKIFEVRAEVFIPNKAFTRLNASRVIQGKTSFINPRNAAAGSLKQLDPTIVSRRPLDIIFHSFGKIEGENLSTIIEFRELLTTLNLNLDKWFRIAHTLEELRQAVKELNSARHSFPYATDGAVIKVNQINFHATLGSTSKYPKWACAFKYRPEQGETILHNVTIQVGRTGVLTPVAELEPIFISGTTVSRATLHNQDEIKRKDIRIGDTVVIEKAGEIIPAVVKALKEKRPANSQPFNLYDYTEGKCPSCNTTISQEPGFSAWRCHNIDCPEQAVARLKHFGGRRMLDLEGLGNSVAEKLVSSGLIKTPLDLFELDTLRLAELQLAPAELKTGNKSKPRRYGEKKSILLLESINRAKNMPLEKWLHALGIANVGESAANECARLHLSFSEIANSKILPIIFERWEKDSWLKSNPIKPNKQKLSCEETSRRKITSDEYKPRIQKLTELLNEYDISQELGGIASKSLMTFFQSEAGSKTLLTLSRLGVDPKSSNYNPIPSAMNTRKKPFSGTAWVITGTLSNHRDYFRELIEENGGKVTGSISKKTTYLLAGKKTGSKLDKALSLNVEVLTENQFEELLRTV